MSKYKVGDKVVMEIMRVDDGVDLMNVGSCGCSWCIPASQIDRMSEPLTTYTEPLEAKIRRQAAEITRLLRENKELKNEKQELTRERNQLMGRCGGLSAAKIKAFNNGRLAGQNEAWELARKIVSDIYHGGYNSDELKEIFGYFLYQNIWEDNTYPAAAAKVEAWERQKEEIKVGDIIKVDVNGLYAIVTHESDEFANVVHADGNVYLGRKDGMTKTGRHIDIDSFLKQIGGEE